MFDPIVARIDLALAAMNTDPIANPELDALFARLRGAASDRERALTENRIWKHWYAHEDAEATDTMRTVMAALESGDWKGAQETLDSLVERWPDWAEGWNKRATLHFMEDREAESLEDIARTLEREPRHFGALSGLGQICLHAGEMTSALMAFERVLAIDPGLEDVQQAVKMLRKESRHAIQ